MKLTGHAAKSYIKSPDTLHSAILIFGGDAMRVADARQSIIMSLVGAEGESEMRLTRLNGADLRKDPAALNDALKAQGFFPGHRVAFVEEATDIVTSTLSHALMDWRSGDAQIVVSAGALSAKSKLRKLFEGDQRAVCIGIYDDPPSREDVKITLQEKGLETFEQDVLDAAFSLAQSLEPGDFRQTLEKTALYKLGDSSALTVQELLLSAPQSADVDLGDICEAVANGRAEKIAPLLRNLYAQGVLPVTLCIGLTRYFRRLYTVASDPAGAQSGLTRLRPPAFGPARNQIASQVQKWGRGRLENALTTFLETDLKMRSAGRSPDHALMERALIRVAMMGRTRS